MLLVGEPDDRHKSFPLGLSVLCPMFFNGQDTEHKSAESSVDPKFVLNVTK